MKKKCRPETVAGALVEVLRKEHAGPAVAFPAYDAKHLLHIRKMRRDDSVHMRPGQSVGERYGGEVRPAHAYMTEAARQRRDEQPTNTSGAENVAHAFPGHSRLGQPEILHRVSHSLGAPRRPVEQKPQVIQAPGPEALRPLAEIQPRQGLLILRALGSPHMPHHFSKRGVEMIPCLPRRRLHFSPCCRGDTAIVSKSQGYRRGAHLQPLCKFPHRGVGSHENPWYGNAAAHFNVFKIPAIAGRHGNAELPQPAEPSALTKPIFRQNPMKRTSLAALAIAASASPTLAADLYWGTATPVSVWQSAGNWFQDAAGTTPAVSFPGLSDHAIFSITSLNGTAISPVLNANLLVNAITFDNTVAMTITGTGGNRNLAIGSGGISLSGSASTVTLGSSGAGKNIFVKIQDSQTWTNNSNGTLNIRNSSQASDTASGPVVLTLSVTGAGSISNSGAFSDGAAGSLGLVVDSSGSGNVSIQSSSYTGGTLIKRGTLQVNGANIGTQAVKLGDTSGSANATLRVITTTAIATGLNVQAGNTGTNTLEFTTSTAAEFDGAIALNNTLNVAVRNGQTTRLDGVISGSGSLVKSQYQGGNSGTLLLTNVNTYSGDTTVTNGTLNLADNAALTFYIGANGVNNTLGGTGTAILDGDFIFDLSGAVAMSGNSWQTVNVGTLTETFGSTFTVQGFTESGNVWTNGSGYSFDEATGVLSYTAIPEPATPILLGAGLLSLTMSRRRRGAN